ncbi:hypothetical protein JW766_00035 [Candidatus Dojkabacteria bacterium]|nr:hypothetical protein [Candidatus Dojkabacteria bacterium]
MNKKIIFSLLFIVSSLLFIHFPVKAEDCPKGASDCYLCGKTPCTKNCVGYFDDAAQKFISCNCPQGEECTCYCPYVSEDCRYDRKCIERVLYESGASGYVYAFDREHKDVPGKLEVKRYGSSEYIEVEVGSFIYEGDMIMVAEDQYVEILFPNGQLREFTEFSSYILQRKYYVELSNVEKLWINAKNMFLINEGEYTRLMSGERYRELTKGEEDSLDNVAGSRSEFIFEHSGDEYTYKVLEGEVEIDNKTGNLITVRSGEQFTFTKYDFDESNITPYDYREDGLWWTSGLEDEKCLQKCSSNEMQTPFPGCSCFSSSILSSDDDNILDIISNKTGGDTSDSASGFIICCISVLCIFVVAIVILALIFLIFIRKKRSNKKG